MKSIKIKINGADAMVTDATMLTSGMVGLVAEFEFDQAWEGFTKTAVFKAGDVVVDVVDIGASCEVPWEVLTKAYRVLRVGVYGVSVDGEVVIPTVWATVDEIRLGTDPCGDESTDPTLPVWQQILSEARGSVKSVNGQLPDKDGNVAVETGGSADGKSIHFINDFPVVTPTGHFSVELPAIPNAQVDDLILFADATIGIITEIDMSINGWIVCNLKGQDGYTPLRGTDYWTDADKTEIVNEVLNALPNGDEVAY